VSKANDVRAQALSLVGQNYHLGEEPWYVIGPEQTRIKLDTDCSGLPYGVFRRAGVLVDGQMMDRLTANGLYYRAKVIVGPSRVGDLGFLLRNSRAYHVFMYVGNDQVVEAGDGTGHVGLRTVAHENARGAKWGRLNTDIGEFTGDEMTEAQDKLLKLVRLSMVARSFDIQMIEAIVKNDVLRIEVVRAAQQIAVEVERNRLGLTPAEALRA